MLIVNEYESIPGLHVKVVDVGPQVIPSAGFPAPPGAASTALATMTGEQGPEPDLLMAPHTSSPCSRAEGRSPSRRNAPSGGFLVRRPRLTYAEALATRGAINLRSSVLGAVGTLLDVEHELVMNATRRRMTRAL